MKIPEKVKVASKDYIVICEEKTLTLDGSQLYGKCCYDKQEIHIDSGLQKEDGQKATFIHEVLHAIARDREINFGDADEELLINQFAKGLYQAIKDNPNIFSE